MYFIVNKILNKTKKAYGRLFISNQNFTILNVKIQITGFLVIFV